MSTLDLNSIELVSTLRKVAASGAPSSQDWNDSFGEVLSDLSTISTFLDNQVIPLLNSLNSSALLPVSSPIGIEGRTIVSDSGDQTQLFYNTLAGSSLSIADSLRLVNGMLTTFQTQLVDMGVQVDSLEQRLSSDNTNDLSLAIQSITNTLNTTINSLNSYTNLVQSMQNRFSRFKSKRVTTGTVNPSQTVTIPVTWGTSFTDNSYTVVVSLSNGGPDLQVLSFSYQSSGAGINVVVKNSGLGALTGNLHVAAHYDPESA